MKRYLAIAGEWYYPDNGLFQRHALFDTVVGAETWAASMCDITMSNTTDWAQVWDLLEDKCIVAFVAGADGPERETKPSKAFHDFHRY